LAGQQFRGWRPPKLQKRDKLFSVYTGRVKKVFFFKIFEKGEEGKEKIKNKDEIKKLR
jgi:hypothetical protein